MRAGRYSSRTGEPATHGGDSYRLHAWKCPYPRHIRLPGFVWNVLKCVVGAGRGTRTPTLLPAADFESAASTDSAIPARGRTRTCQATEAAHYRRIGQPAARRPLQSLIPRLTAFLLLESPMNAESFGCADFHPSGGTATHPIARFSSRLAALLLVAGDGHAPPRALPANLKIAHSGTFNRGIKDNRAPCVLPISTSTSPTS